jgi:hypothetical protein
VIFGNFSNTTESAVPNYEVRIAMQIFTELAEGLG